MTATHRVLVLEDDALIRRFVAMALADLPLEIVHAATIAEARPRLAPPGVDLFITDLMLPDGNALDLVRSLSADARHAGLRIVILSAGITAAVRAQASELGVFRVLDKPVPYAALVACVEQALADGGAAAAPATPATPAGDPPVSATERELAIEAHFDGQAALFDEFFADCVAQFPSDVVAGDRACAARDAATLRRVAHNLKPVLKLVGSPQGHAMARQLEQSAAAGADFAVLVPEWDRLRAHVQALCRTGD